MKWTRKFEKMPEDGYVHQIWHATPPTLPTDTRTANSGPKDYRVFGRSVNNKYVYRTEYQLETGWWPVGTADKLRDAKELAEQDVIKRMATPPPAA